jgi:hypothetical protein
VLNFYFYKNLGLFLAFSLALSAGCTAQRNTMFKEKAREVLQSETVLFSPDPSTRFVLCYAEQKGTPQQPANVIRWVIYDSEKKIFRPTQPMHTENGEVKWQGAGLLRVLSLPGMMRQGETPEDYARIFEAAKGVFLAKEED